MKTYQAYATGAQTYGATPRQAAREFFSSYPNKRKCNIIEGARANGVFTISYGRASEGEWPTSYRDVTKKQIDTLPDML